MKIVSLLRGSNPRRIIPLALILLILGVILFAQRCSRPPRPKPPIPEITVSTPPSLLPSESRKEEIPPQPGVSLVGLGRDDPFQPLIISQALKEKEHYIPSLPSTRLRLTGIISNGERVAIMEAEGKDYFVRIGDWVGDRKVVSIREDRVILKKGSESIVCLLESE